MSRIPKVDKKPKNNKSTKFRWVDSQWEKLLTEQKELKTQILQLEMGNAELKDRLVELGEDIHDTPNDMQLGKKIREKHWDGHWIYESPDGGETIYRRKFGDYDNKELVENPNQMEIF